MSPEIWMLWGVISCDFKKGFKPGQMPPAQPQAKSAWDQVGSPGTASTLYNPSLILRVTPNAATEHQEQLSAPVHASCGSLRPSSPVPSSASIPLWAHQPSQPVKQATLKPSHSPKSGEDTEIKEQTTYPTKTNPEIRT